jgi:transposase
VRVGIEATGHARWFERLLAELKFELWIGDPARIKAARVRKQKTDLQDAQLLLRLRICKSPNPSDILFGNATTVNAVAELVK